MSIMGPTEQFRGLTGYRGIDVSSHQGPDFPFEVAWRDGYRFAIIKASGGHSYRNPYLGAQVARARAAGLRIGYYHYWFEPSSGGGDVMREVANFLGAILPYVRPGDTFWNDVEEFPKAVGFTGDLGGAIDFWCDEVQRAHGGEPGIYCATWYIDGAGLGNDLRLTKRPYWIASWQQALPDQAFMRPWKEVTIWQYDAFNRVAGRQPIDEDLFIGDEARWDAIAKPGGLAATTDPWAYLKVPFGPKGHTVHPFFHGDYSLAKYGYPLNPGAEYGIRQPDGSLLPSGLIFQQFENGIWSSNGRGEPKPEAVGQVLDFMTGGRMPEWPEWVPLVAS